MFQNIFEQKFGCYEDEVAASLLMGDTENYMKLAYTVMNKREMRKTSVPGTTVP